MLCVLTVFSVWFTLLPTPPISRRHSLPQAFSPRVLKQGSQLRLAATVEKLAAKETAAKASKVVDVPPESLTRFTKGVKQVATLGPKTWNKDTIEKLFLAGVDVFRLNLSHGAEDKVNPRK